MPPAAPLTSEARRAPSGARGPAARPALARLPATVLAAAAEDEGHARVAFAVVEALAGGCGARRAALACTVADGAPLALVALSGQARIDPRRAANRRLLTALADAPALDFDARGVAFDLPHGGAGAARIAVRDATGGCAAVLLERDADVPWREAEVRAAALVARDACLLLLRRARAAAPRRTRLLASWREGGARRLTDALPLPPAVRARLTPRQTLWTGAGLLGALVCLLPVPLTVTARASLEAEELQIVSAADSGHLVSAHARPGDRVGEGELLARLDDGAAVLELEAGRSEAARNTEELARALATRDRAALGELRAEGRRIAADVADAERRIDRAALRAPFESVVLKGDPSRRLGAPVAAGEALFELGSADSHRLVLAVDEHDVRLVGAGMVARVRLAGAPGRVWDARLGELLPVAVVEPGTGAFRVPAELVGGGAGLRAGMEGVARVRAGTAPLIVAWTRGLRERATLLAWRFGLIR